MVKIFKEKYMVRKNIISLIFLVLFFSICLGKSAMAEGGSLFLLPGSESFTVDDNFSVELKLDTAGIPINAAESIIYFPTDKLEVLNISKDNSIFPLWPKEPVFSNETGEISFIGGLPHPGFKGEGNIITINFKTKEEGAVNLSFDLSRVLADDGKGTNILMFIKEAKYFIYPSGMLEKKPETETAIPFIFSSTHPNEQEWYNNDTPRFQWDLTQDIKGVSFVLDKNSKTIPDTISEGLLMFKNYEKIPDGIWYFHLRLEDEKGWEETIHHRIQVDTHPPRPFEIIIDNSGDSTNPKPNLYFETDDDTSGISGYQIKIGKEKFLNLLPAQINPFALPLQSPGNYKIIVRAADKANNLVRTTTLLNIEPIETPKINVWPEKYIAGEETFYIEGTALPELEITIFLKKNGEEVKKWQTPSNSQGQWFFTTKELIPAGTYYLSVMARDKRGAVSNLSDPYRVEVSFSGFSIGNLLVTFKNLIWALILGLFLGIVSAIFLIYKNYQTKKTLKKETQEAKDSLSKNFSILRREIEGKIGLIDLKPGLSEEEKRAYEGIKNSLQDAESSIDKEIKDIEKEL